MKDIVKKYDNAAAEYARSRVGTEDITELEKLRWMLHLGDRVLDVGCAGGRDTRILKDMGFNAVGTDLSKKLLDIARMANPDIEFVLGDMRKLPFNAGLFRAVWASAVLHHIDRSDMNGVLNEFNRVLMPNGLLYVHTKEGKGKFYSSDASMLGQEREFELVTAEELDVMLQDSGFVQISLEEKVSRSREGLTWLNAFYRKRS